MSLKVKTQSAIQSKRKASSKNMTKVISPIDWPHYRNSIDLLTLEKLKPNIVSTPSCQD